MSQNNVWYLPGPFHRYQEDVKALAKSAGLRIIDANATANRVGEADQDSLPKVTLRDRPEIAAPAPSPVEDDEAATAHAFLDTLDKDGKLTRPESGELALRIYRVLDGVRQQMDDFNGRFEALTVVRDELQAKLDAIAIAGADDETAQLKAKLDAAGVQYRANASKESLQKLVEELPKA